jgi:hypothetical protein
VTLSDGRVAPVAGAALGLALGLALAGCGGRMVARAAGGWRQCELG